jgi:putative flippase GtrA
MKNYLRTLTTRDAGRQITRLAVVGLGNTAIDFILFNLLRTRGVSLFWSITIAFGLATFASYVINRRWTFGLGQNSGGLIETFHFYLVNLVAWGATILIVTGADTLFGPLGRVEENVAKLFAAGIILIPKFASYRDVVFRKAIRSAAHAGADDDLSVA